MRVFILSPSDKIGWLSPAEVVARWKAVFEHLTADREAAMEMGEERIAKCREWSTKKAYDPEAVERALAMLRHRWNGALVVEAWDGVEEFPRFRTIVRTDDGIYLEFPPSAKYQQKRRIANKAAEAIGYRAEYSEEI